MKTFLLSCSLLIYSIISYCQEKQDITIDIKGLKGFVIFEYSVPKNGGYKNKLKIKRAKRGKIKFKIKSDTISQYVYTTSLRNLYNGFKKGSAGEANNFTFLTEPKKSMVLRGTVQNKIFRYEVLDSELNFWLLKHRNLILPYLSEIEKKLSKDNNDYGFTDKIDSITYEFIKMYPNTIVSVRKLNSLSFKNRNDEFIKVYNHIDIDSIKKMPYGQNLEQRYLEIKKWNELKPKDELLGKPAPVFSFEINGQTTDVDSFNKYILLDFWGSWCKPCLEEMNQLAQFNNDYNEQIQLIGVSYKSNKENFEKLIKKKRLYYPQLFNAEEIVIKYGIDKFPSKVLVSPNGTIVLISSGSIDDMKNEILKIVNTKN